MERVSVGVIGCGTISDIYLENITQKFSREVEVCACADLNRDAASAKAAKYGIKAMTVEAMLNDESIELILNLTVPMVHAEISKKALMCGKHVYSEKPLAVSVEDARELVCLSEQKGLSIGCAPDTFMGGGMQTVIKMLDSGTIGKPIACNAMMLSNGPETFHPHPEFLYQKGAGPLFDMGPYYVTAMVAMFGAVKRVAGMSKPTYEKRTFLMPNRRGEQFPCQVDTHISGILEFRNGVHANLILSWDMKHSYWESKLPLIEVFGEEGAIMAPDPNMFGGISSNPLEETGSTVRVRCGAAEFKDYPLEFGYTENVRGIGLADMAYAMRKGKLHRASGELTLHVLEILAGLSESGKIGRYVDIKSDCTRPRPIDSTEF